MRSAGCDRDGRRLEGDGRSVRHHRLIVPHQQPLVPPPALLAPQPPANVLEQHLPPAPVCECLLLEQDAAIARLTEGPEDEGAVISQGAEDEGAGHGAV